MQRQLKKTINKVYQKRREAARAVEQQLVVLQNTKTNTFEIWKKKYI